MSSAIQALQDAIVTRLRADATLIALVGNNVFDEVPADEAALAPGAGNVAYIYMGPANKRRLEVGCYPAWTVTLRIYGVSDDFGRLELWDIGEQIDKSLEGFEPTLANPFACDEPLRVQQSGDTIDPLEPKAVFVDVTTTITRHD